MLGLRNLTRGPAALEERPAAPEHDRRRQRELDPVAETRRDDVCASQRRHAHIAKRPAGRRAPRSSRNGASCRAVRDSLPPKPRPSSAPAPCRRWDSSRAVAHDLGMHGAGPLRFACDGKFGLQRHAALGTRRRDDPCESPDPWGRRTQSPAPACCPRGQLGLGSGSRLRERAATRTYPARL